MLTTVLIGTESWAKDNKFDVYLFIGQSNCAGRGPMLSADTLHQLFGVSLLDNKGKPVPATAPMNRFSNIRKEIGMQMMGPAYEFSQLMHSYTGKDILIVQNARGGSAMKSWQVGGDGTYSYTDSAIVRTRQALRYGTLKGIVWHQGETDIQEKSTGNIYVERFKKMIDYLRKELGVGNEVPVIVGEVGRWKWHDMSEINAFNETTLTTLTQVVPNCHKVSSEGLARRYKDKENDPHFSRDAQIELGRRYADAMLPLVSDCYVTKFKDGKQAAISFTYDDGLSEHYDLVAPELEKRGFRGSFWIIGNNVGMKETPNGGRLNWEQIREMANRGHDMGSHTWDHAHITQMKDEKALLAEFEKVDSAFISNGLPKPTTVAYPFNGVNRHVRTIAEKGRIATRVRQVGHGENNNKTTPEKLSKWLRSTIDSGDWGVTMTHGIKKGYDIWFHPEWLWNFYDEVKAKEDSVWVGTFAEVGAYIAEREHTAFTQKIKNGSIIVEPKQCDKYSSMVDSEITRLDPALFNQPLTLRINGAFEGETVTARQGKKSLEVENRGKYLLINVNPYGGKVKITHSKCK